MKKITLIMFSLIIACSAIAQEDKRPTSYNYQRGVEAIQKQDLQEALEYFNKDLQEDPKNGYSYSWIAMIRNNSQDFGQALTAADMAIKYLPKKDKDYVIFAYSTRAAVYLSLEDTIKAMDDYNTAIKVKPDESELYNKRAQIYYEQNKYDLADADYKKMIELKPGDVMGYMGLGRDYNAQGKWNEAIEQFDYVTKLASDYSSGYSFRADAYLGLKKWNEATDDIVNSLICDWDKKALYQASNIEEPAKTMLIAKLKVQAAKNRNEPKWPYILGLIYETNKEYAKAIEYYEAANKINVSQTVYYRIANSNFDAGNYEQALTAINHALDIDSTDVDFQSLKANTYYEMGNVSEAIKEWDKVLTTNPDYAWGYYRRGWFKDLSGDFDGAVEDLSMSIVLDPDYAYSYDSRGEIYKKQGKNDMAEADFKKVIDIENKPEKYDCIQYAYIGLGQYEKAIAAIDTIIARDTTDAGNYYDAACAYCRMGNKAVGLKMLEKSLKLGYRRFAHIQRDADMDLIRDTPEFKALIGKYSNNTVEPQSTESKLNYSARKVVVTEVPFTKENGVCKVKCKINNLPLHFIFDTGASDVTLSIVEATFMMKNDYLSPKDVIGSQSYMNANGEINVGTVINLRKVQFGELELDNVRASVVRNQQAPLLLGQSVLGRLGKIEIDNSKNVLKISHDIKY